MTRKTVGPEKKRTRLPARDLLKHILNNDPWKRRKKAVKVSIKLLSLLIITTNWELEFEKHSRVNNYRLSAMGASFKDTVCCHLDWTDVRFDCVYRNRSYDNFTNNTQVKYIKLEKNARFDLSLNYLLYLSNFTAEDNMMARRIAKAQLLKFSTSYFKFHKTWISIIKILSPLFTL